MYTAYAQNVWFLGAEGGGVGIYTYIYIYNCSYMYLFIYIHKNPITLCQRKRFWSAALKAQGCMVDVTI